MSPFLYRKLPKVNRSPEPWWVRRDQMSSLSPLRGYASHSEQFLELSGSGQTPTKSPPAKFLFAFPLTRGSEVDFHFWVTIKLVACKYRQYKSRIQNMIVFASPALSLGIEVRNRMQFFHSRTTLYHTIFVIVPWDSGKPKQI